MAPLAFPTHVGRMREAIHRPGADTRTERRIADSLRVTPVGATAPLYNHTDSSTANFLVGRWVESGRVQRDRAALRRECGGLVLHRDGAVLVRPLHRFFSLGQTPA